MRIVLLSIVLYSIYFIYSEYCYYKLPLLGDIQFVCINLKRSEDRKWGIEQQARTANVESLLFYEAVDGRELELTQELKHMFRNNDFNYRGGVMGCALSHYNLWKTSCASNTSFLILEDDMFFHPQLSEKLNTLRVPNRWDIIIFNETLPTQSYLKNTSPSYRKRKRGEPWIPFRAYALHYNAARKLRDIVDAEGMQVAVDWFVLNQAHRLNIYVIDEPLFISNDTLQSTIR